ncbi:hypothetical protein GIB67_021953 [Kingdonia uniflora]|uniref:DNA topoisomerase (ATP-hydrolyzing) n=1 Tax=Kingdonia uniflora TaxID=39325 RepID=A0A7J7P815_9MAGN|nr:hypothetical protein GIB67_021953 [Kingdonia uniflora]
MADLQRSIPSMVDGLKPGQRKILFCSFKQNFTKEAKVAQFSGYVSGHSVYHHGEYNHGGKDHASARYVYTCLSPITRFLFPKDDDCLLDYLNEDGQSIEPTCCLHLHPDAAESKSHCTSKMRLLIDEISTQQEQIGKVKIKGAGITVIMAMVMNPPMMKTGYEEPQEQLHHIRINLSSKSVKNLEKVCANHVSGAKSKLLKLKRPVRLCLQFSRLPLGNLPVEKVKFYTSYIFVQ